MESTSTDEREAAVRASLAWYEDVFALHGIPTLVEGGLWRALADPPPWHSAAKTLRPGIAVDRVLEAVEPFAHCSVADSHGTLDLTDAGFDRLFTASWLFREAAPAAERLPPGWSVVTRADDLARWSEVHDYAGVLLPPVLDHPRFTVLVRQEGERMVGGAVLHVTGTAVELSNCWAAGGGNEDVEAMVACAAASHPGLAVVGYAHGEELSRWRAAGFRRTGAHVVWAR